MYSAGDFALNNDLPDGAPRWTLRLHPELLALASLPAGEPLPEWAAKPRRLRAVVETERETTVILAEHLVPSDVHQVGPVVAFDIVEQAGLYRTGVLAGLLSPLAGGEVAVKVVAAYHTDIVLMPLAQVDRATNIWRALGHEIMIGGQPCSAGHSVSDILASLTA